MWEEVVGVLGRMEWGMRVVMVRYGSSETRFGTGGSDVDVTLLTGCYVDERAMVSWLGEWLEERRMEGEVDWEVEAVENERIRIPLLKIKAGKGKRWEFEITVNNLLGVLNT